MTGVPKMHKAKARRELRYTVIVCSTSRYQSLQRGESVEDGSGDLIVDMLRDAGQVVLGKEIIPDDKALIAKHLKSAIAGDSDAVIISGGTGITPTDVTVEAIKPLLEKELPGFGELLRRLSFEEIGPSVILTRALAGVVKGKVVFCIPGSPNAAEIALEKIIIDEAPHVVEHASGHG